MSLQVGPDSAGDLQRVVNVWAEDGQERYAIGTLSLEAAVVPVRPQVVGRDALVLRHDAMASPVRFYVQPSVAGGEEEAAVFEKDGGGKEEEVTDEASWVQFRPLTEEDEAELYDSDNDDSEEDEQPPNGMASDNDEEEDDDGEEDEQPPKVMAGEATGESSGKTTSPPLVAAPPGTVVPDGPFLGPARFTSVENTAGFMRVAPAAEDAAARDQADRREITVFYRYTRFSRTWNGQRGVEACRRTKIHCLLFAVPPAGDTASSLAWAGASLGPLIYPALFRRQLHELWTNLAAVAPAIGSTIPPLAMRIQVVMDAAIPRRNDYTTERMEHMRGALEAGMQEAWPELYHVGMELHLPEPLRREGEQGGEDAKPGKRRKIVFEEGECSVCFDPLDRGLVAWPGCRHVFHGACVEKTLARSDMCPLCRNKLRAGSSTS